MRRIVAFALLSALVFPAFAKDKDKDKSDLNRLITHAKYVYVTTFYQNQNQRNVGSDADRVAVDVVEENIRKWGRYTLTLQPESADIIIAVRSGAPVTATGRVSDPGNINVRIGQRPPWGDGNNPSDAGNSTRLPPIQQGPGAAGTVGPSDDVLEVYSRQLGGMDTSSPIWRGRQNNGLVGREPGLFKKLKKEVEQADKEDAQKKP